MPEWTVQITKKGQVMATNVGQSSNTEWLLGNQYCWEGTWQGK